MTAPPELQDLFFDMGHADPDHVGGGTCLGLGHAEPAKRLLELSEQYLKSLRALASARSTGSDDDGWAFGGAPVFMAHHACELALKAAWLRLDPQADRPKSGYRIHALSSIVERVRQEGGWSDQPGHERVWMDDFIGALARVTADGSEVRYAEIDDSWCCVNIDRLADCVEHFQVLALLVLPLDPDSQ